MTLKTVRILSLDGGGIRGYFSATFLKRFCQDAGITSNQLFNAFDIITGTSIGGIQALGYAYGKSPEEMLQFFATKGADIFYPVSIWPIETLKIYKARIIMSLSSSSTFYGQDPLKAALEEVFGTTLKLSDLPGKVMIPSWDAHKDESILFSNITGFDPFMTGADQTVVNVGLATSAAPVYFPPASVNFPPDSVNKHTLIDGGVYVNNPVTLAYSVAKKMFPSASRFCVLNVGTGVGHNDFIPETSLLSSFHEGVRADVREEMEKVRKKLLKKYPDHQEQVNFLTMSPNSSAPYNVDYLFYLMDNVFIKGPQELNAKVMEFESTDLYDDIFFYRFQYQFLPGQDSSMDNYSEDNLFQLAYYANAQYDTDIFKIQNFIAHFNVG